MKTKRIFYENEERNFYWVTETPKQIKIDWIPKLQTDGTPLDQNVRWKNLIVGKEKNKKHCLSLFEEDIISPNELWHKVVSTHWNF